MLTAAAAVTRRLEVGFAVMQLALRPPAAGRLMPGTGLSVFATLASHVVGMSHQELVDMCAGFGYSSERADAAVLSGKPARVAERLASLAEEGVEHAVIVPFGGEWRQQCDLLAEAKALL